MQEQFQELFDRLDAQKKAKQEEEQNVARSEMLEASKKRGQSSGNKTLPIKKPRTTKAKGVAKAKTVESPAAAKEAEAVLVSTHAKQKELLLSHLRG